MVEWVYKVHMETWVLRILCGLCAIMSICVIWSETFFGVTSTKLSIFYWLIQGPDNAPYVFQVILLLLQSQSNIVKWLFVFGPIAYIALCAYWTLFQLRIFNFYRLIPYNSDGNSILFSA